MQTIKAKNAPGKVPSIPVVPPPPPMVAPAAPVSMPAPIVEPILPIYPVDPVSRIEPVSVIDESPAPDKKIIEYKALVADSYHTIEKVANELLALGYEVQHVTPVLSGKIVLLGGK